MSLKLNQSRALENFRNNYFNAWEKEFNESYPKTPITVDWETLFSQAMDYDPEEVATFWKDLFFEPLKKAVDAVGRDELGKKSLENLKKIVIRSTTSSAVSGDAILDNGIFTIDQNGFYASESADERAKIWQGVLEDKLV